MAGLPVESSWRMVDGENDSFDTSIVPSFFGPGGDDGLDTNDDDPFVSSSGAPSQQSAASADTGARRGLPRTTSTASRGAISSQEDRISLGGDSFSGSIGGSQDDDIHSFLRKAENGENDERVLLRSPFQPSLPSSVRQSPLSAGKAAKQMTDSSSRLGREFQTPEPEFRMPTIGMDGSLHADGALPLGQRMPGVSSAFHVSDTGSPALRKRTGVGLLSRLGRMSSNRNQAEIATATESSKAAPATTEAAAAWTRTMYASRTWLLLLFPLLGLAVAYGATFFPQTVYSTAVGTVCSLPGISHIGLPFCPPPSTSSPKTIKPAVPLQNSHDDENGNDVTGVSQEAESGNYWAVRNRFNYEDQQAALEEVAPNTPIDSGLVRGAGDLMRSQTQLAAIVRQHILAGRGSTGGLNKIPPAQDAWLVPRTQTKELRMAAQIQQGRQSTSKGQKGPKGNIEIQRRNTATLLVVELDAYLEAAKHVSITLTRLQTGAAAIAADTLAYRSRQTLAQLRRMAAAVSRATDKPGGSGGGDGWLARIFTGSSSSYASASRRRELLLDAYRHHTDAVLAKTQLRVKEAEAVVKALEGANGHLTGVQSYVTARRDELVGAAKTKIKEEATGSSSSKSSTGGGPGGDPMLDVSGGIFSWLWSVFGQSESSQGSSTTSRTAKMSKSAREWSGYADRLQRLREDHDATVMRAVDTLDELAAVRDALSSLQLQFSSNTDSESAADDDLDLWLHMDIVDAGIQDLESAGLR
ncbi:hypothetical protein SEUCBS140593_004870 [Sporothrix eucalyptigena]|uniref:Uncharacterized protein n=1 Tax=Sporothrix eucalyptigena TaxID=1812306 RepID=A0ABP0BS66_9PEZI